MSYDLQLLVLAPGEDPRAAAYRDVEIDEIISPDARSRIDRVVSSLRTFDPELELFESPTAVELSDVKSGSGMQIGLYANSGSVSLPYWHEGVTSAVLQKVSQCLRILSDEGGYVVFDPQVECVLTPESGFAISQTTYAEGVAMLKAATKRSWWKFW